MASEVRTAFAHEAVLTMEPGGDIRAPGAAITVALCGHWEHPPPCPLAPHFTSAARRGREVHLRILFAAQPSLEGEVRRRIGTALAEGQLAGPEGKATAWELGTSGPSAVSPAEQEHAARLTS